MYTGSYKNPEQLARKVHEVDDFLSLLKVGVFVSVRLENYKRIPIIGKVIGIEDDRFQIEYWKGTWYSEWKPHLYNAKNSGLIPWTDSLPKECIIFLGFDLDGEAKLTRPNRKYLKERYASFNSEDKC